MDPYYVDDRATLWHGKCEAVLATLPSDSVDAVVCDPPYGLEFMGKEWDAPWTEPGINADAAFSDVGLTDGYQRLPRPSFTGSSNPQCLNCRGNARGRRDGTALRRVCACDSPRFPNVRAVEMRAFQEWCEAWAVECLRVLKPGGYLLAFGGTRTVHRLTSGIEDAGFEIRDGIDWLYGQGFPKSLNLGDGRGTALKPAREPIVMARKPLAGTVAMNLQAHGTGVLNIDSCRVASTDDLARPTVGGTLLLHGFATLDELKTAAAEGRPCPDGRDSSATLARTTAYMQSTKGSLGVSHADGRWPTNVVLSHAGNEAAGDLCADGCVPGCPVVELDQQSGVLTSGANPTRRSSDKFRDAYGEFKGQAECAPARGAESGGASRFFPVFRYEAKASTSERPKVDGEAHATVKPLALMRWLVQLVTPPGGLVLEPFAGSGTTVEACLIEGYGCIAVEREAKYLPLIMARINKPIEPVLFGGIA